LLPPLYPILDPSFSARPLLELADVLATAGAELLQLRDKRGSARTIYAEARTLVERFASSRVRIIINDRPDIAKMAGAGGVHVGQEDLPLQAARAIVGERLWVGVSTHNVEQLRGADATSADYVAIGPIFPTGAKGNPDPVVGVEFVRTAHRLTRKPLVAIGGITVESAAEVFGAGADSIAVVRDLLAAPDPARRAQEYLEIAARVFQQRGS
jgi:thiamine-phosphate pyrophosphorylase